MNHVINIRFVLTYVIKSPFLTIENSGKAHSHRCRDEQRNSAGIFEGFLYPSNATVPMLD